MTAQGRMRGVMLGWDLARPDSDITVYYCNQHGHMQEPCKCIDDYFKAQVREQRARQDREIKDG